MSQSTVIVRSSIHRPAQVASIFNRCGIEFTDRPREGGLEVSIADASRIDELNRDYALGLPSLVSLNASEHMMQSRQT